MGGASLPPGFRFHPTDEELIGYYLKRKVEKLEIELEVIPVIDLYKFDPWELPEKSFLPKRDMEWFFFCPRDRKYPNGSRTNRATKAGYWKATGKDRKIVCQSEAVTGYRKTLVFYRGRAPLGDRTDWVMHEYRLCDENSHGSPTFQGAFALCRIVKKNEHEQKTGDFNGEVKPKRVGISSSSNGGNFTFSTGGISNDTMSQASPFHNESYNSSPITTPMASYEPPSIATGPTNIWVSPDFILDSSKDYQQGEASGNFPQYEYSSPMMTSWNHTYNYNEFSSSSSYSNFTEEIEPMTTNDDDFGRIDYNGFWGN